LLLGAFFVGTAYLLFASRKITGNKSAVRLDLFPILQWLRCNQILVVKEG
jgi:hypothetical protein